MNRKAKHEVHDGFTEKQADAIANTLNRVNRDCFSRVSDLLSESGIRSTERILTISEAVNVSYRDTGGMHSAREAEENAVDVTRFLISISKRLGPEYDGYFIRISNLTDTFKGTNAFLVFDRLDNMIRNMQENNPNYEIINRTCEMLEIYGTIGGMGISEQLESRAFANQQNSDNMIRRMLDDRTIEMVMLYHSSYSYASNYMASGVAKAAMRSTYEHADLDADAKFFRVVKALENKTLKAKLKAKNGTYVEVGLEDIFRIGTDAKSVAEVIERAKVAFETHAGIASSSLLIEDIISLERP